MANYYKSYADALATTGPTTLLTVPSTSSYIVSSIIISNVHASTDSTITVTITDNSETQDADLINLHPIVAGLSQELLERSITLESNDTLKVQAADANVFEVYVSYMEHIRET